LQTKSQVFDTWKLKTPVLKLQSPHPSAVVRTSSKRTLFIADTLSLRRKKNVVEVSYTQRPWYTRSLAQETLVETEGAVGERTNRNTLYASVLILTRSEVGRHIGFSSRSFCTLAMLNFFGLRKNSALHPPSPSSSLSLPTHIFHTMVCSGLVFRFLRQVEDNPAETDT
jgi:hypothetical protein